MVTDGADMIDLGAVSTRPGAGDVSVEEEWRRLEPTLKSLADRAVVEQYGLAGVEFSIDTTSSEIVRRAFDTFGRFIVNDISAGEDDRDAWDGGFARTALCCHAQERQSAYYGFQVRISRRSHRRFERLFR